MAFVIAAAGLAPSVTAVATPTSSIAVATLNKQRALNGIDATLVERPDLSRGCGFHLRYLEINKLWSSPRVDHHAEDPGLPGFTSLGAAAGRLSELVGSTPDLWLGRSDMHPWSDAPLHNLGLMAPGATEAWYGGLNGAACMGTNAADGVSDEPPTFFSVPGPSVTNVFPSTEVKTEIPFNPATRVGFRIGEVIGPFIYLFARGAVAPTAPVVSVSGPDGAVPVRVYQASGTRAVAFVATPLRPRTRYSVTVTWAGPAGPAIQSFPFTTTTLTERLIVDRYLRVHDPGVAVRQRAGVHRGWATIVITGGRAVGTPITLRVFRVSGAGFSSRIVRPAVKTTRVRLKPATRLVLPLSRLGGSRYLWVEYKYGASRTRVADSGFFRGYGFVRYAGGRGGTAIRVR